MINNLPALRVDDAGVHTACCGPNQWRAMGGSATVFINGKPAFRKTDPAQHCGGVGQLIQGSPDVDVGGPPTLGMTRSDLAGWHAPPPPAPAPREEPLAARRAALASAAARGTGLIRHDCERHPHDTTVEAG